MHVAPRAGQALLFAWRGGRADGGGGGGAGDDGGGGAGASPGENGGGEGGGLIMRAGHGLYDAGLQWKSTERKPSTSFAPQLT